MTKKDKRLRIKYETEYRVTLAKEFKLANYLAAPSVSKIVVNMGTGEALKDKGVKERLIADMALITGQKPKINVAKASVAGFGIRKGNSVGLSTTLRGERMYAFLEKLIAVILPRLRDFRGTSLKSFDKNGNYTIGLSDYSVFPEIDIAKIEGVRGLEISIVTNTYDQKKSKRLLEIMGMPFEKE